MPSFGFRPAFIVIFTAAATIVEPIFFAFTLFATATSAATTRILGNLDVDKPAVQFKIGKKFQDLIGMLRVGVKEGKRILGVDFIDIFFAKIQGITEKIL